MHVRFSTPSLAKLCNDSKSLIREFGPVVAKKLMQRLAEMDASPTLADMGKLPGPKLHPLTADRKGQWAVTVHGGVRMVFVPDHEPVPKKADGGVDTTKVTAIKVQEVKDYH